MRRHLPWIATVTAALTTSACVSMSYTPRNTPYVKLVQVDGAQRFRVGDRDFSGGLTGGLEGAVQSVPEALAHAQAAESDVLTGLILTLVGAVLVGVGGAGVAASASESELFGSDTGVFSTIFLVGGLAMCVGGAVELSSGMAHQLDAMNIFNDTMWLRATGELPAADPGALPPLAPLPPLPPRSDEPAVVP